MAITWTETNTTTTKQPGNQHHKEVRMEDQTNLSSMVRRLQAQVSDMCRHLAEETMVLQKENAQLREVIGPNDVKMKYPLERRRSQQPLRCQRPPMLVLNKTYTPSL